MGALVAAIGKDGKNMIPKVAKMLNVLRHRGKDSHGVAANNSVTITRTVRELASLGIESDIALGQNFARIVPSDMPQPVQDDGVALVFEGRLFPPFGRCEVADIVKMIRRKPEEEAKHLIEERDGSYAFAFLHGSRIIAGRDPVGAVPLYYGESVEFYALASERKALWSLNMSDVKSFPPGNLAIIDRRGISFRSVKTITKPPIRYIEENAAIKELHTLLLESIRERTVALENIALAFSGGLDSSLIALLAKKCGLRVLLVSVGLEGQAEIRHAEQMAEMLGLPFKAEVFAFDDIENVFSEVLWLIEEPNALKISVAIPIFWAAEKASKLGYKVLLSGQGSDELFGGYHRYLGAFRRFGFEAVENALFKDTFLSYETNFERDNNVCAFHGVELRLPFTDFDLISFSLSLPLSLKIESEEDPLRKRILRKLSKKIGLPPEVYNRPKKAIQYATGVDKALKKLANRKRQKLQDLVEQSFRNYKMEK